MSDAFDLDSITAEEINDVFDDPDLLMEIYLAEFGATFNAYAIPRTEAAQKNLVSKMREALKSGKALTDADLGLKLGEISEDTLI